MQKLLIPPRKRWYQFHDPDWPDTVARLIGWFAVALGVALIPWLRANWWQVWPWLLILGIPLLVLWVVVRIIRHAWKG